MQQTWQRLLGMVQEIVGARCKVEFPLGKMDTELVERLGIMGSPLALFSAKRRGQEKQKIDRNGKWQFPLLRAIWVRLVMVG